MSALRNCIWGVVAFVASVPGQEQPKSETPRVLLIGDVSWNNHFQNAQKALKTKATVVRSPLGYLSTGASLTRIDELLQDQRWDLVCINFGLSDLMYRDPRSKRVRAMSPRAGGVQITRVEDYSKNLANLVARLRKSSSRVLWLTTMPLQPRQRTSANSYLHQCNNNNNNNILPGTGNQPGLPQCSHTAAREECGRVKK